ncbi:MAG TPA: metal-sensing transcriptional repressor [Bacillota bacterium]|nr:metal-sensing transcriptional repressor [Bacillota bacterium]
MDQQILSPREDEDKIAIINRLKRIEGQVRGLQKMIEDDRYCVDVLIQISAINAALKSVGFTLMEEHTKHCVSNAVKSGNGDAAFEELIDVFKQFSK